MLSSALPIVNRNEARKTLQGIHLSQDGIIVTNGKELLNIPCGLPINGLNLPFPLVLLSAKPSGDGQLPVWKDRDLTMFRIAYPKWNWTSRILPGVYPNWKQVLPPKEHIRHTVEFLSERGDQLEIFLKNVPENPPHNQVELSMSDPETLYVQAGDMRTWITATFQLHEKIHETFDLVRNSVESELHGNTPVNPRDNVPQNGPKNGSQGYPSGAAKNQDVPARSKQIKFLLDLARTNGVTPEQIKSRYRVNSLEELTRMPCSKAIDEFNGFFDNNHFDRSFRKIVGISPSKYRDIGNC